MLSGFRSKEALTPEVGWKDGSKVTPISGVLADHPA